MNDKYLQLSLLSLHSPESEPSCILVGNANHSAFRLSLPMHNSGHQNVVFDFRQNNTQ